MVSASINAPQQLLNRVHMAGYLHPHPAVRTLGVRLVALNEITPAGIAGVLWEL